jgi:MFS family permease
MLLSSLGTSIPNVGLPTLAHAFGASFQAVQWIVLAYLLAITTLIVSVGRLGDVTGRRRLMLAGIALFTAASFVCGAAPVLWLLIAARAVQGLGAAIMMALTMAFVGEIVPKERTGRAMGLLGTMSATGTALGPSLGGVLIAGVGWPAIFLVNVPLGIVTLLLARRYLPVDGEPPSSGRTLFDNVGTVLLALTLAAYALAMTSGRGRFGPVNIALLAAALAGAVLFVRVQARAASPLIRLEVLRKPGLRGALVTSALVSTVMMATLVVGPFHLSRALGLDAAVVGLVVSAGPLVAALTGVPAGRMVDAFGAKPLTFVGLGGMAAAALALSLPSATLEISGYLVPMIVITASYALFQAANNTAVMADVRHGMRGVISGMLNLSRNLGLITGASVMGAVFALASSTTDIMTVCPEAVAAGMRTTFAVATILIVVALAIAVGSPRRRTADVLARRRSLKPKLKKGAIARAHPEMPARGPAVKSSFGSAAARMPLLPLLAHLIHLREPLRQRILHDGLLLGRERRIKVEPRVAHLRMQRRIGSARAVGGRGNRREIRLGLRELGRKRVMHLLHVGAGRRACRLAGGDRVIPHRLLGSIEAELALEAHDAHHDVAATTAAVMEWLRRGDTRKPNERCRHAGGKRRNQSSGHDSRSP